jgi:DNA-binding GntR family transcriptional regulator
VAVVQAGPGALRLSPLADPHGEGSLESLAPDRSTLAARAHDAIRAAIQDGRLAAGERYSVARLAERFGISRTPVREALLLLEREGVVRFERNRGVRVLETTAHDLEEVFTLRLLLEVPATYRACALLTDADLDALAHELDAMDALARGEDERAFMAHDTRFHEIVLLAAGNHRLATIVGGLRNLVRFRGASTVGRSRGMHAIHAEHAAVLEALCARDAHAAAQRMREHLVNTARLLLAQEGETEHALAWAALVRVPD